LLTRLQLVSSDHLLASTHRLNAWINFSAFLARYLATGLSDRVEEGYRYKYPAIDIKEGLEVPIPTEISSLQRCKIIVAANWIILAGRDVAKLCFGPTRKKKFGLQRWTTWKGNLLEVERRPMLPETDRELYNLVTAAREKMETEHLAISETKEFENAEFADAKSISIGDTTIKRD
jgi:hypothetical protein